MALRLLIISLLILAGCSDEEDVALAPVELNKNHACIICGMILVEYPGPKAQIHYKNGDIDTFCCTPHMFMSYLQPERPRQITASYVHDMGKADWNHPENYWIDAGKAFYVFGGNKMGAMGETLVPFSALNDAQVFVKQYGGKILKFDEITMDMLKPAKPHRPPHDMPGAQPEPDPAHRP